MQFDILPHARIRMLQRHVADAKIAATLAEPDDRVADRLSGRDGFIKFINGRLITAMVEPFSDPPLMVTVVVD
jgi:hypothetical protein